MKTVTFTLNQMVMEMATVTAEVPDDISEDDLDALASKLYEERDDLDWEPDNDWGCEEGTHSWNDPSLSEDDDNDLGSPDAMTPVSEEPV